MTLMEEIKDEIDEKVSKHKKDCSEDLEKTFVTSKHLIKSFWKAFASLLGSSFIILSAVIGYARNTDAKIQSLQSEQIYIKKQQEELAQEVTSLKEQFKVIIEIDKKLDVLISRSNGR